MIETTTPNKTEAIEMIMRHSTTGTAAAGQSDNPFYATVDPGDAGFLMGRITVWKPTFNDALVALRAAVADEFDAAGQ